MEGETGSYGLAGAVAGTLALVGSLTSPQWARAMDRRGQGLVLRIAFTGYLVFGIAFVAAVVLDSPQWTWFVLAGLTGACGPNIGSIVRARWADALDADPADRLRVRVRGRRGGLVVGPRWSPFSPP